MSFSDFCQPNQMLISFSSLQNSMLTFCMTLLTQCRYKFSILAILTPGLTWHAVPTVVS